MGTCSGDKLNCVSGVSVPEVPEGESGVFQEPGEGGTEAGGSAWV